MRATASTSINFGVINVPVQLFKATKSNDVRFNMCAPDGSPVEQVYRKKDTEEIVGTAKDCGKAIDGFQIDADVVKAIDAECKLEDGKDLPAYQYILTNKKKVDDFRERFGLD